MFTLGCEKLTEICEAKFLDTYIISNIVIFTLFLGLYCDFYHVMRFLPYLYFAKTNNGVLSRKSWDLKDIRNNS